ncbi:hypothetical protein GCM10007094_05050 [Pseudovibrio japonicus]|uniref:Schlafen AlbA-2 domain-containing protein n=1 Tax=Pseudovibrio japonicus TaxID=366534 RepID=A0ABQ3DY31_9HYPH|nr:ATP-binding protein [Pseudovibrio japonicus]GHB20089.1 hypothetical protein GCM10007094_05050 [Pseudovibrio japonicus]
MPKKRNSLSEYEVSIIKKLLDTGNHQNQEISGMINRFRGDPEKDISTGRISNIKNGDIQKYIPIEPASDEDVQEFLSSYNVKPAREGHDGPLSDATLSALLRTSKHTPNRLVISETDIIECKEGFNLPIKTIAAFANNKGGYLVLGVKNETWEIVGVSSKKSEKFDFNQLNQLIRSNLGIGLEVSRRTMEFAGKIVEVFYVSRAHTRPVILSKQNGDVSEGQIYFRYIGEDRLITPTDLSKIIEDRVSQLASSVLNKHLSNILKVGIENAAIMNLETGEVDGKSGKFCIEKALLPKLRFIKEGEFQESSGKPTLKLVGEVEATEGHIAYRKRDLLKEYPLSYKQLIKDIKSKIGKINNNTINREITKSKMKHNESYSSFIFTNDAHLKRYKDTGVLPTSITSRYKNEAVNYLVDALRKT